MSENWLSDELKLNFYLDSSWVTLPDPEPYFINITLLPSSGYYWNCYFACFSSKWHKVVLIA